MAMQDRVATLRRWTARTDSKTELCKPPPRAIGFAKKPGYVDVAIDAPALPRRQRTIAEEHPPPVARRSAFERGILMTLRQPAEM
jgi:hypothetical protein